MSLESPGCNAVSPDIEVLLGAMLRVPGQSEEKMSGALQIAGPDSDEAYPMPRQLYLARFERPGTPGISLEARMTAPDVLEQPATDRFGGPDRPPWGAAAMRKVDDGAASCPAPEANFPDEPSEDAGEDASPVTTRDR